MGEFGKTHGSIVQEADYNQDSTVINDLKSEAANKEKPKVEEEEKVVEEVKGDDSTVTQEDVVKEEYKYKQYGFEDDDSVAEFLKKKEEYDGTLSKVKEYEERVNLLQTENQKFKDEYDPRSAFANDDLFKLNQLIKKFPGQDPSVIAKVQSIDLETADPVRLMALKTLLDTPGIEGGEQGALEVVKDMLGIDSDANYEELEPLVRNKIKVQSAEARNKLKELMAVEMPDKLDYDAIKQKRDEEAEQKSNEFEKTWEQPRKELIDSLENLTVSNTNEKGEEDVLLDYKLDLGTKEKNELNDYLQTIVNELQYSPDKGSLKDLKVVAEDFLFKKHRVEIMSKVRKQAIAELEEKHHNDIHNVKDLKNTEKVDGQDTRTNAQKNTEKLGFGTKQKESGRRTL